MHVDGQGDIIDDLERIFESALEGGDDDDGVNVSLQLGKSLS